MKLLQAQQETTRARQTSQPSDELSIAVTFRRPQNLVGPTKLGIRLSSASVMALRPDPFEVDKAVHEFHRRGFIVSDRGPLTISVRGTRLLFEKVFGTKLVTFRVDPTQHASAHAFYYPPPDAPWQPDKALMELIDDAYIQWPHTYMAKRPRPASAVGHMKPMAAAGKLSPTPPKVSYFHLEMPRDVPRLLNVERVHAQGTTGRGVRVVMIDSGFGHSHPYFPAHKYSSSIVLAASATNNATDKNGHGTGESANIFAVAPGATFIGVKLDDDNDPRGGATILEGLQEALKHNPHVISVSLRLRPVSDRSSDGSPHEQQTSDHAAKQLDRSRSGNPSGRGRWNRDCLFCR